MNAESWASVYQSNLTIHSWERRIKSLILNWELNKEGLNKEELGSWFIFLRTFYRFYMSHGVRDVSAALQHPVPTQNGCHRFAVLHWSLGKCYQLYVSNLQTRGTGKPWQREAKCLKEDKALASPDTVLAKLKGRFFGLDKKALCTL